MLDMHKPLVYTIPIVGGSHEQRQSKSIRPGQKDGSRHGETERDQRGSGKGCQESERLLRQSEWPVRMGGGMSRPPRSVSDYMAKIGKKGGETKGPKKKRSTAHYKAAAAKRWAK